MHLNIKKLVDKHFPNKSQFAKAIEIGYPAACKLYDGNVSKINFDTLEKICEVLHCTPNDILVYDKTQRIEFDNNYQIDSNLYNCIKEIVQSEFKKLSSNTTDD